MAGVCLRALCCFFISLHLGEDLECKAWSKIHLFALLFTLYELTPRFDFFQTRGILSSRHARLNGGNTSPVMPRVIESFFLKCKTFSKNRNVGIRAEEIFSGEAKC